jgi:hypothetical protein
MITGYIYVLTIFHKIILYNKLQKYYLKRDWEMDFKLANARNTVIFNPELLIVIVDNKNSEI